MGNILTKVTQLLLAKYHVSFQFGLYLGPTWYWRMVRPQDVASRVTFAGAIHDMGMIPG